jgi:hypothetical protein
MVRLTVSPAAYDAILASPPTGSVAIEPKRDEEGNFRISIERRQGDELRRLRRPGESSSDVAAMR